MDQRTEPIEQDIAAIRESMTAKMGQIEDRIRSSVEETGESLKRTIDLKYQVEQHPWTMVGTAVLIGYAVGALTDSSDQTPSFHTARPPMTTTPYAAAPQHEDQLHKLTQNVGASANSFLDDIKAQFGDELELVKAAAVSSAIAFLRDVIRENLPGVAGELERIRRDQGGSVSSAPTAAFPRERGNEPRRTPVVNNEFIPPNANTYAPS